MNMRIAGDLNRAEMTPRHYNFSGPEMALQLASRRCTVTDQCFSSVDERRYQYVQASSDPDGARGV